MVTVNCGGAMVGGSVRNVQVVEGGGVFNIGRWDVGVRVRWRLTNDDGESWWVLVM